MPEKSEEQLGKISEEIAEEIADCETFLAQTEYLFILAEAKTGRLDELKKYYDTLNENMSSLFQSQISEFEKLLKEKVFQVNTKKASIDLNFDKIIHDDKLRHRTLKLLTAMNHFNMVTINVPNNKNEEQLRNNYARLSYFEQKINAYQLIENGKKVRSLETIIYMEGLFRECREMLNQFFKGEMTLKDLNQQLESRLDKIDDVDNRRTFHKREVAFEDTAKLLNSCNAAIEYFSKHNLPYAKRMAERTLKSCINHWDQLSKSPGPSQKEQETSKQSITEDVNRLIASQKTYESRLDPELIDIENTFFNALSKLDTTAMTVSDFSSTYQAVRQKLNELENAYQNFDPQKPENVSQLMKMISECESLSTTVGTLMTSEAEELIRPTSQEMKLISDDPKILEKLEKLKTARDALLKALLEKKDTKECEQQRNIIRSLKQEITNIIQDQTASTSLQTPEKTTVNSELSNQKMQNKTEENKNKQSISSSEKVKYNDIKELFRKAKERVFGKSEEGTHKPGMK